MLRNNIGTSVRTKLALYAIKHKGDIVNQNRVGQLNITRALISISCRPLRVMYVCLLSGRFWLEFRAWIASKKTTLSALVLGPMHMQIISVLPV